MNRRSFFKRVAVTCAAVVVAPVVAAEKPVSIIGRCGRSGFIVTPAVQSHEQVCEVIADAMWRVK